MSIEPAIVLHVALTMSLTWIWFASDFPVWITQLGRQHKILPQNPKWWPEDLVYDYWMRHEWEAWMVTKLPTTTAHWLSCPTCFATRVAIVAAIWTAAVTGHWILLAFFPVPVFFAAKWLNKK